ncbi:hypothetical protein CERSUDRAFT_99292 [Gelatoporia subvermispora B]|uniref:BRCA2 OB1 domain-containing protein n=1 Tax=Ceriporiopsis subvermispora (strain B) TaxID=914234 RepID=M2R2T9_CERS8|nr:hypothetical protein CERSUDRAFT_99292 [Gelatoporia subvermispora B]
MSSPLNQTRIHPDPDFTVASANSSQPKQVTRPGDGGGLSTHQTPAPAGPSSAHRGSHSPKSSGKKRLRSSSPPPNKSKHQLSSPTYDQAFDLSQQDIEAFDAFEKHFSQSLSSSSGPSNAVAGARRGPTRSEPILNALQIFESDGSKEDDDDSIRERSPSPLAGYSRQQSTELKRASSRSVSGFRTAASLSKERMPATRSESAKISPTEAAPVAGFTSAAVLPESNVDGAPHDGFDISATPAKFSGFGFASALHITADLPSSNLPSSSPDAPQEHDYSDWFKPMPIPIGALGFQSAKAVQDTSSPDEPAPISDPPEHAPLFPLFKSCRDVLLSMPPSESNTPPPATSASDSALPGFTSGTSLLRVDKPDSATKGKAKASSWIVPSAAALARAREKMQQWQKEIEEDFTEAHDDQENAAPPTTARPAPSFQTPLRPALRAVENSFSPAQPPESPSPAGAAQGFAKPLLPSGTSALRVKNTPFKSPLVRKPAASMPGTPGYVSSPLNPSKTSGFAPASGSKLLAAFAAPTATPSRALLPLATPTCPAPVTPVRPSGFSTPAKTLGLTPRRMGGSASKPRFATPFKEGMRPGEPGRKLLEQQASQARHVGVVTGSSSQQATPRRVDKGKGRATFFDMRPPADRQTLATSGLLPQRYSQRELEDMGIPVTQLEQINLSTAFYYAFHSVSADGETANLGCEAAFTRLKELGCSLATEAWVENHWVMILWKLAGMIALEPWREIEPETRRWCWDEVIGQLLFRYERELNSGSRPALRLIAAHDAPPSCPMILCVSAIIEAPGVLDDDGVLIQTPPDLEVTDGWYKLRAKTDAPLGRAVKKGLIRVGRKIEVAGARFADRKDPCEILEAYSSVALQLHGNSTKLAPWHAKLGFVRQPAVSTLDSLTPDGGLISLVDLVVVKLYDIGFVEYTERDGRMAPGFPHDQKTETKLSDQWGARREAEASRLHGDLDRKVQLYLGYAERLERKAGIWAPSLSDSAPDDVDKWYSELEDNPNVNQFLSTLTSSQAGWLARHIRQQIDKEREGTRDEIERELDVTCPPRNVRNFRVVVFKDAQWRKRPPLRQVQLKIADVLSLHVGEGEAPGSFKEGQRFRVTNLMPEKQGAWMVPGPDSLIYLKTVQQTRWTRIK